MPKSIGSQRGADRLISNGTSLFACGDAKNGRHYNLAFGSRGWRAARSAAQSRLDQLTNAVGDLNTRHPLRRPASDRGGVAERLKAADCKSALFGVRWFESSPLHQSLRVDETGSRRKAFRLGARQWRSSRAGVAQW